MHWQFDPKENPEKINNHISTNCLQTIEDLRLKMLLLSATTCSSKISILILLMFFFSFFIDVKPLRSKDVKQHPLSTHPLAYLTGTDSFPWLTPDDLLIKEKIPQQWRYSQCCFNRWKDNASVTKIYKFKHFQDKKV